jgi:hypothetical protein
MTGQVYFYYALNNFHQNHRRYTRSRNNYQLLGSLELIESYSTDCSPFDKNATSGRMIAPCGAMANSMFNDTFTLTASDNSTVPFTYEGVAWDVDVGTRLANPLDMTDKNWDKYDKPPAWSKPANQLDPDNPNNNGFLNVDFMVWMRIAALPNFRKLYRRLDRNNTSWPEYKDGLPADTYHLLVDYSTPTANV